MNKKKKLCSKCGWYHGDHVVHNDKNEPLCVRCMNRPAEFEAPDTWCEKCWNEWWHEDMPN